MTTPPAGRAPARTKKPAATPAAKPETPVVEPAQESTTTATTPGTTDVPTEATQQRVAITLQQVGTSKNYKIIAAPEGSGCVGKFYVPFTVEEIKMLVVTNNPAV